MATGLERSAWQRVSTPEEIAAYLDQLAAAHPDAEAVTLGSSVSGRPLRALVLRRVADEKAERRRLLVMLVGSQHGTEPSGGEALQILAREAADGAHREEMDFIIVPDSNPDGRAARRRVNANGVNLSTDYALLSEPESRAIDQALARFRPDVVLDVHESAILKKKSLGAQGYMTDFEAQVEYANHPDVDPAIATLSRERVLPQTLAGIVRGGVRAQHYMGEITDVAQPITHGGLSARNLRNKAGLRGAVSFLIENRLDPPGTTAPTPRNIQERVRKQLVSLRAFLDACRDQRAAIEEAVDRAREAWRASDDPVHLSVGWGANPAQATVRVPLRRIADGVLEERTFALHDAIEARRPLAVPLAYAVTDHQDRIATLLDRHGIEHTRMREPERAEVVALRVVERVPVAGRHGWGYTDYELQETRESTVLAAGTLWIPTRQPLRSLIPLLLEPRSNAGIFQDPSLAELLSVGERVFFSRVESAGAVSVDR